MGQLSDDTAMGAGAAEGTVSEKTGLANNSSKPQSGCERSLGVSLHLLKSRHTSFGTLL